MKKFVTTLMVVAALAAVSCSKNPVDGGSTKTDDNIDETLPAALQHSSFIPIIMDGTSFESVKSKVALDLRVNDSTNWLWIWSGTYNGGAGEGLNFFGNTEGYVDLVVSGADSWSGAGFCIYDSFTPEGAETPFKAEKNPVQTIKSTIGAAPQDWVLHVAYKGQARVAHILGVDYAEGGKYSFAVGQGSLDDAGVTYNAIAPKSGEFEAGEWMEYEIPVSELGIDFSKDLDTSLGKGYNMLFCLSGGVAGTEIKLDAVYFYKK